MSVRNGVLALLSEQPMHTSQVKQQFEHRTGGTWPLNIGQVYSTLQRLVRDGLVEVVPDEELEHFRLTDAGQVTAQTWWATPVTRGTPGRDELAIKLALAVTSPGVDVRAVVQAQRTETMRAMRDMTRLRTVGGAQGALPTDLAWSLVLDSLVFAAEAEIRWLDHVEARVARAAAARPAPEPTADVVTSTPERSGRRP